MRKLLLAAAVIASGTLANAGTYGGPYDDPNVGNFNPGGSIHDYGGGYSDHWGDNDNGAPGHSFCGSSTWWLYDGECPDDEEEAEVIPPVELPFTPKPKPKPPVIVVTPPIDEPSPVPLMGTGTGLATALGALAWFRRRRHV